MNRGGDLSALALKCMAMLTMLVDHMGYALFPQQIWMRCVGRLAFPIFAFLIAEGCERTRDMKKYLGRMALFAVLSEIPFNLMCDGRIWDSADQNVLWTFLIAMVGIWYIQREKPKGVGDYGFACGIVLVGGFMAGQIAMTDYGGWGVLTVLVFYLCRDVKWGRLVELVCLFPINCIWLGGLRLTLGTVRFPIQALALCALVPIWLYKGRQGPHPKIIQYACYAFYPVHILVVALVALYTA